MGPGAERHYWKAVSALREAETLAQLSAVSGPADEPPKPGDNEQSWIEDWSRRANETLQRARTWAESKNKSLKDRAKRIVGRVREGARAVWQATGGRAGKIVDNINDTITRIQFGALAAEGIVTVFLVWIAYKVWFAPKAAR